MNSELDYEVGLSEPSFLWLAAAGSGARHSVYEALRDALNTLRSTKRKRSGLAVLMTRTFADADSHNQRHDVAFWNADGRTVYIIEIKGSGQIDKEELESRMEVIRSACAEPPKVTSFNLAQVASSTQFADLVDALSGFAPRSEHVWPTQPAAPEVLGHAGIYKQLPAATQLLALETVLRFSAGSVWGIAEARKSMKAILDHAQTKPQLLQRGQDTYYLMHTNTLNRLADKPSAAEDARFFFSRRSPVSVPALSSGRGRAAPLIS